MTRLLLLVGFAQLLLPIALARGDDTQVDDVRNAQPVVHCSLSDAAITTSAFNIHDEAPEHDFALYSDSVSHDPGRPAKPIRKLPGDIINKAHPEDRYCLDVHERAGNPGQVAWWARCAINEHYSAWFVGGGTAWTYPHKARVRSNEEGTWGMDYDGIFAPRRVWMNWSKGRKQGGLGAYETDGARGILEKLKHH